MRKLSELLKTRGLTFSQFCEHVCVCSVLVISHVREHIETMSINTRIPTFWAAETHKGTLKPFDQNSLIMCILV